MLSDRCLSVCLSVYNVGVLWPKGWINQDVGLDPSHIVLYADPGPPSTESAQHVRVRPLSIVVKRSPISATAELLFRKKVSLQYLTARNWHESIYGFGMQLFFMFYRATRRYVARYRPMLCIVKMGQKVDSN